MSSRAPKTAIVTQPSSRPITCRSISTNRITDSTKPQKMARPPMRGIGWSLMRRSFGTSMASTFTAKRRTGGVRQKQVMNATSGPASSFHTGKDRETFILSLRFEQNQKSGIKRAFRQSRRACRPCAASCGQRRRRAGHPRYRPCAGIPSPRSCGCSPPGWAAGSRSRRRRRPA